MAAQGSRGRAVLVVGFVLVLLAGCGVEGSSSGEATDDQATTSITSPSTSGGGGTGSTSTTASTPPEDEFDLEGTVWRKDPLPGEQVTGDLCAPTVRDFTFLPDGGFSYESRCGDEEEWRSYDESDDSWWVEGEVVHLSYNDGFKTCEGAIDPETIELECLVQGEPNQDVLVRDE